MDDEQKDLGEEVMVGKTEETKDEPVQAQPEILHITPQETVRRLRAILTIPVMSGHPGNAEVSAAISDLIKDLEGGK